MHLYNGFFTFKNFKDSKLSDYGNYIRMVDKSNTGRSMLTFCLKLGGVWNISAIAFGKKA